MAESAYQLGAELKDSLHNDGGMVKYSNWIGATRATCYEMKAIWGLSIALWWVHFSYSRRNCTNVVYQHPLRIFGDLQRMSLAPQQSGSTQGHRGLIEAEG